PPPDREPRAGIRRAPPDIHPGRSPRLAGGRESCNQIQLDDDPGLCPKLAASPGLPPHARPGSVCFPSDLRSSFRPSPISELRHPDSRRALIPEGLALPSTGREEDSPAAAWRSCSKTVRPSRSPEFWLGTDAQGRTRAPPARSAI